MEQQRKCVHLEGIRATAPVEADAVVAASAAPQLSEDLLSCGWRVAKLQPNPKTLTKAAPSPWLLSPASSQHAREHHCLGNGGTDLSLALTGQGVGTFPERRGWHGTGLVLAALTVGHHLFPEASSGAPGAKEAATRAACLFFITERGFA